MQINPSKNPLPALDTQKTEKLQSPPPPDSTKPISNPEAFKKSVSSTDRIPSSEDQESLSRLILDTSSEALQEASEDLPVPNQILEQAKSALKHVTTLEKTGLESAQAEYLAHQHDATHLTHRETDPVPQVQQFQERLDFGLFKTESMVSQLKIFSAQLQGANREGQVDQALQTEFKQALKNLDKADRSILAHERKTQIQKVVKQTQNQAKDWIEGLGANHDLTLCLKNLSQDELKHAVREMVGALKDYDSTKLSQLSEKKEQFIAAIVAGLQEGFASASPSAVVGQVGEPLRAMQQELSQKLLSDPDMRLNFSVLNRTQFHQLVGDQIGVSNALVLDTLYAGVQKSMEGFTSEETLVLNENRVPVSFELNGRKYVQPKFLAEGGFADVFRYQEEGGTGFVAVKISKAVEGQDPKFLRQSELAENKAHLEISGQTGHDNIIGLKGMLKTSDDRLLTVQEFASGGSLRNLNQKLTEALEAGVIPYEFKQLIAISTLKGVLEGAQHMEQQGGYHFDIKVDNFLMGSDLKVKMTDFGLAGMGTEKTLSALSETADNPIYKSPERLHDEKRLVTLAKKEIQDYIREEHGLLESDDFPADMNLAEKAKYRIDPDAYQQLFQKYALEGLGEQSMTTRGDQWGVGVLAYELLIGSPDTHAMYDEKFMSKIERNIKAFGDSEQQFLDAGASQQGEDPFTRLANSLMAPKAEDRISFEAALQSSLFQDPRLSSPLLETGLNYLKEHPLPEKPERPGADFMLHQRYRDAYANELADYAQKIEVWKAQFQPGLEAIYSQISS
ncbi:hypothetical protein COW36_01830 [bacterium (Candidatus Blackallbacteria) CG17_big_fil_post_rev_8_21_14_2_50_48_46]|uniref:Protein kinase domain-containing protein n=1 Tax=bacterium (Candidatus Blackallbacteria) CG17_big_fil_post_rev_8_21_14_2_50_48_46 TaxID=2014261 RepID=A0A2M7GAI3_9BACT|nr:MAG: hypothetical protein COW64_26220 [bacterium (Candidatus Blackallbacteria) CG18_big_fil_WC_8_21_14_2_50_49_26]PIW19176.1 MAG: hypothetical protein COW36_01830 [bacterium (Candidatus Blackallbacteria) CG17_big_fil_post_rev_8_21_14_2_50_48_46]PIW45474.1 MAG: hypothetical protein COW20_20310 [bacterium (Candidatus Blackallbacteria) CG13_big_fil_rev_8_21_14_2_50_49_14]